MEIKAVTGQALLDALPEIADLRLEIFREFPYLYDGDAESEAEYLKTYAQAEGGFVALALAGGQMVGAATALPLGQEVPELQQPFRDSPEFNVSDVLYIGEVLLRPGYRGKGAGGQLLRLCEAHAAQLGLGTAAFAVVVRPEDHPKKPADYQGNGAIWQKRGYTERPDLTGALTWKKVGENQETTKAMRFWVKNLHAAALDTEELSHAAESDFPLPENAAASE